MSVEWGVARRADLPLDVAVLSLSGVMMLAVGGILVPVSRGLLPVYENGLQGLLLFLVALHMMLLGKTPFGDPGRSRGLLLLGGGVAASGIVTCFVPDLLGAFPRVLLFLCFTAGGAALFLQMLLRRDRLSHWKGLGRVGGHLVLGCSLVYLSSIPLGIRILQNRLIGDPWTAVVALVYGGGVVYLSWVLLLVRRTYPNGGEARPGPLQEDRILLLLVGLFMLLLGGLLTPVHLGLLPFSGSAQLGLLMVLFAVQMLAFGSTPLGAYPRSWPMILLGMLFALLGTFSCLVPETLVPFLTLLVGWLNIGGGVLGLRRLWLPLLRGPKIPRPVPPILLHLYATQTTLDLLSLLFGTSMLVARFLPGLAVGGILAANGGVLLYLVHVLVRLDRVFPPEGAAST